MQFLLARIKAYPIRCTILLQLLAFLPLQAFNPSARLSFVPAELIYVALALVFLFARSVRLVWRKWFGAILAIQSVFVVSYYNLHEGTLSLVSFFMVLGPGFLWGLFELIRWSIGHIRDSRSQQALFLSALSWGVFAFAYPPLPMGPAALALLAPWIFVMRRQPMGRVLFATFWSGIIFHSISYFWIFNVAKVGPAPAVISGLFLLVSYFSMFYVVGAWFFVKLRDKVVGGIHLVWFFPLIWAGIEVLRSYGQISFPWGHLGYVFGNHVPLVQGLAYIGVYGYTLIILYSNMLLAKAMEESRIKLAFVPLIILVALWFQGIHAIHKADDEAKQNGAQPSMRFALVQPSISQTKKWSREYFDSVMTKTWSILDTVHTDSLDLVVLPETAVPDFLSLRPREDLRFRVFAREHHVELMVGALNFDRNGPEPRHFNYYNSAFLFQSSGVKSEYRKTRLVPFSEYLPFNGLIPVINYVDLGEGDFSPGDTLPTMGLQSWTPNICYESIYPDVMRRMVRNGTRLVVNITNDGWFGKTTAPGQHANLIRYRAVEAGLPIARCANSGISIFYDAQGRAFEKTGLFETRVVYHRLNLRNTITVYTMIGDFVETLLSIIPLVFLAGILLIPHLKRKSS